MRVDGDSTHAEHVKILDALSSNLKSEVARGLRLLDSCVTQIAQARWILTNVDDSLSGFSKGCPVCGILPEKEKQISKVPGGKEIKDKRLSTSSASPKRNTEVTPPKPKSAINQVVPTKSLPPKPKPVHRIGPRSKTRPNEPVASSGASAVESVAVDTPKFVFKPATAGNLPQRCSIVVLQTRPDVKLTDIRPYLKGRVTRVDLANLGGFVSPTQLIPNELKFKPTLLKVKSHKPVKQGGAGAASRRFFESLKKSSASKALTPPVIIDCSSDDEKPLKPAARPPPPAKKPQDSDSGSDYDYNFAAAATAGITSVKKKSKIGSQVPHSKRSRPLSTDSDEDYDIHRKKKGSTSIFKKKVSTSSDSDSDSDEYERKRKRKIKRKDSTDKEKEKHSSGSKTGSKPSSVVSSRTTIILNSGSQSKVPQRSNSTTSSSSKRERHNSSASRGGGSTTGSLVKSESGKESQPTTKPAQAQAPTAASVKTGYRPGPASRKIKPVETPAAGGNNPPESKGKGPESTGDSERKGDNSIEKVKKSEIKQKEITNGTAKGPGTPAGKSDPFAALQQRVSKEAAGNPPNPAPAPKKLDPLAMLREKLRENTEAPPKDKPATKVSIGGMSGLMDKFDPQTKAKLAARLAVIAATQNKGTAPGKPGVGKRPGPLRLTTPGSAAGVPGSETEKPDDVEEEKEIELGDDIIGKCIGDLGVSDTGDIAAHSPAPEHLPFTLSPMPPPTLQDCVSPTAMHKFFSPPPEPDSPSSVTVEKILRLLLKLVAESSGNEPQLHSRDKLNELFGSRLSSNNEELETDRIDLLEGNWYVIKGKTLGRAVCADTVSVYDFEKVSSEELSSILAELETYTASSCR